MKRYVVLANPYRQAHRLEVLKYTDSFKAAHNAVTERCRWDAVSIYETATGEQVGIGDLKDRPR